MGLISAPFELYRWIQHNPNHGFVQHVRKEFWVGPRLTPKCSVITCTLALIQQGKPESVQMQFQQVYIDKRRAALAEQIAGLKAELAACEEELSSVDKSDPSRGQKRESQGGPSSKEGLLGCFGRST